jgi:hypothetical protein
MFHNFYKHFEIFLYAFLLHKIIPELCNIGEFSGRFSLESFFLWFINGYNFLTFLVFFLPIYLVSVILIPDRHIYRILSGLGISIIISVFIFPACL